jgi:hypothetical protein
MNMRWRRIIVGGLFVLLLPVACIALLVLAGPDEREAAVRFAETLSRWPDLLLGIGAAVGVGWFVARPVTSRFTLHGALVGVVAAAFDVLIVLVAAVPFEWSQPVSIVSVIAAGAAGGALAERRRPAPSVVRAA